MENLKYKAICLVENNIYATAEIMRFLVEEFGAMEVDCYIDGEHWLFKNKFDVRFDDGRYKIYMLDNEHGHIMARGFLRELVDYRNHFDILA